MIGLTDHLCDPRELVAQGCFSFRHRNVIYSGVVRWGRLHSREEAGDDAWVGTPTEHLFRLRAWTHAIPANTEGGARQLCQCMYRHTQVHI